MYRGFVVSEEDEKLAFARAMLACGMNPLAAGQLVHPANFNRAAEIASKWHWDATVKKLIESLRKEELNELGMSEDEIYIETHLKKIIENSVFEENKLKAIAELKDLKGLSRKNNNAVVQANFNMPKAIVVHSHGTNEEWEKAAKKSSDELESHVRTRH